MPNDCIFCQIVAISKDHHETLGDLPEDTASDLFSVLHDLTPAIEAAVDADASNVAFNNGEVAGQEVPHVHGHIIPRFDGDGGNPIHAIAGDRPDLSDDELDAIADDIRESQ
jgi:histidine triad (HIT) family protein